MPRFDTSFNFGANVKPKKGPKKGKRSRGKGKGKKGKGSAFGS
jgi:hypothetical protein